MVMGDDKSNSRDTCTDSLANVLRMRVEPDCLVDDVVGPPHLGRGAGRADWRAARPDPHVVPTL